MTGSVSQIQRFSVSDGPGVRTTAFLKGCPLRCLWCHNPETQAHGPQLLVYEARCTLCGACAAACRRGVHEVGGGKHEVRRAACIGCGACAEACPSGALEVRGRPMDACDVLRVALRDRPFYETTKGGLTVSGGEPLAQYDFTRELLQMAKAEGLHTCLDTSGYGGRAAELSAWVDLYLIDVKETDPRRHEAVTGAALAPLLAALGAVDEAGGAIRLRCPIVPGVNDRVEHVRAVGRLAASLRGVEGVDLIPYHNLGVSKAAALGMSQEEYRPIADGERETLLRAACEETRVPVRWHQ